MKRVLAPLVLCLLAGICILAVPSHFIKKAEAVCPTCPPPPPPPPKVGEFGGPLAGLNSTITGLFNGGYSNFVIKWDPIRGLGPVSTKTGCFTCHGAGTNVLTGTAGDTSNTTGHATGNGTRTIPLTISTAPALRPRMKAVRSCMESPMQRSVRCPAAIRRR